MLLTLNLVLCIGYSWCVNAALLVSEDFNYTDGSTIKDANGGTGWSNAWSGSGEDNVIISDNLDYTGAIAPSGGSALRSGGNDISVGRSFSTNYGGDGDTGTSVWISFLAKKPGGFGYGYVSLGGDGSSLSLYAPTADTWFTRVGNTNIYDSGMSSFDTVMMLYKVDFASGAVSNLDDLSVWYNPDLSGGEAGLGAATVTSSDYNFTFDSIGIRGWTGNSMQVDNIKIGEGFADVVAIPEPGTFFLLGLGLLGMLAFRKRS